MRNLIFLFFLLAVSLPAFAQDSTPLTEMDEIGKSNCINRMGFRRDGQMIIRNEQELSEAIRDDASRERCLEVLSEQNISFHTHILVGANIVGGNCGRPYLLNAKLITDYAESKSEVVISYTRSKMQCKALYSYSAWYLVPKPLEGFTVDIKLNVSEDL